MDKRGIYAVIPAYNEKNTIGRVVSLVKAFTPRVVVVDDGSSDGTGDIAAAAGAHVIRHDRNSGYDRSIEDGFHYAAQQDDAFAVFTFDADGQHRPEVLGQMVHPLIVGEADLVVGIRAVTARIAEKMLAFYARRRFGLIDPLCGLKAYKVAIYRDIGFFDRIRSIGTELTIRAILKGYRIKQIPIPVAARKDRSRFGQSVSGNYKIFMAMVRIIINL